MNLRRKLFTVFGGLALLALSTAGVTLWSIARWQATEQDLQNHYQRSLLLQRVRAATFRATREVSDALLDGDPDAAAEFEAALEPVEPDFQRWVELATTEEEKQQVEQVRAAYQALIQDSQTVFRLLAAGQKAEALQLAEGKLEEQDFRRFEELTEQAVASDQQYRQVVRDRTQNTRQTAQLVLAIAAVGILSLILLLAAYLASDLFAPLRETEQALDDVARGDMQRRLDADRQDELGAIHRAFNRMIEAIAQRGRLMGLAAVPSDSNQIAGDGHSSGTNSSTWQNTPSRLMLHTLVSQLRSRVTQLHHYQNGNGNSTVAVNQKQEVIEQLDQLLQAVSRVTEFGFPLDLNLANTDIRALLYEVLLRFHEEFVQRHVSYELQIAPEVNYAFVDRLKLREALGELVRNALAALPEQGGRIGVRASLTSDRTELLIEVADDGKGTEPLLINQAFEMRNIARDQRPNIGLKLTRAIVEQHGGQLLIDTEPNQGAYVQIRLPLRK
jgi:two-component system, OmpR family, sensor kinase